MDRTETKQQKGEYIDPTPTFPFGVYQILAHSVFLKLSWIFLHTFHF